MRRVILVAALIALAASTPANAATVKVDCSKGGNLQSKLNSAPGGSTILIKGTCVGSFTVSKRFFLKGNPTATLDANDTGAVLDIQVSKPIRLENLRIVDGTNPNGGGIIAAAGDALTLVNVTVAYNRATFSGGGIASNGIVTLIRSTIANNTAEAVADGPTVRGGGIIASSVTLTDSTVRNNAAHATGNVTLTYAYGGGIFVNGSSLVALRSHIDTNTARADGVAPIAYGGGAIQQFSTSPIKLTRSTMNGNVAQATAPGGGASSAKGGAVYGGWTVAARTLFVGNRASALAMTQSATAMGGAIDVTTKAALDRVSIRKSKVEAEGNLGATVAGGGISVENTGGKLTITRSTISGSSMTGLANGNAIASGGGVHSGSPVSITTTTIGINSIKAQSNAGSAAARGGGIRTDGKLTLQSSTVSGNTAVGQVNDADSTALGGGVSLTDTADGSRITNATITKNTARAVAAIAGVAPPSASAEGGGLDATLTTVRFVNATVARNKVMGQGLITFIRGGGLSSTTSTVELRGTIIAANTAPDGPDCAGPFASLGYNLIGTTANCTFAALGSDKRNRNAKLGKFGGSPTPTIRLLKGSPALNAIPKSACKVKRDQRGVKRPQEKKCEIGAWERRKT